ncbi:MAG: hypothetical protein H7301_12340 [Cryobacterium sp.]|nr:hypothetical protein [Oligoflexia bacterium]
MKITLDLGALQKAGKITVAEKERLFALSKESEGSHALSILFIFASIAVAMGLLGLNSELFIHVLKSLYGFLGDTGLQLFIIALLLVGGTSSNSGFLIGLAPFVMLGLLGGSTFYSHASYFVAIQQPALTVLLFSCLALAGLWLSHRVNFARERLALVFARVCMIIVNMGLWVGSLSGSEAGKGYRVLPETFSVIWAIALLGVGIWGARSGRRFVVNTCAVFGSIHFYTQWFERLGASPGSLLSAGVLALGILSALKSYNRKPDR